MLICPFFAFTQVNMEKVLIEMGTATWNSACASEVALLNQMEENGLEICIINYHLNDPFANQFANHRASYYNIQSVPYPIVGGTFVSPGNYDNYIDAYNIAINTPSYFTISVSGNFLQDSLFVEAEINRVANYESDSISLHLALTESDINFEWQGLSLVHHVERSMAPDAGGNDLDFSSSNIDIIDEKFIFEGDWDPSNMQLIAFIQNDTSKEILQCHSIPLTSFSPLPVHAFFQVADTLICQNNQIQFENYSTGDVETVQWFFEGANPEESNQDEPHITYPEVGAWDVQLIVSNAISTDTNFIEDYIHVQELPPISFAPLPVFCHDQEPYQLAEGSPEEGHYFGLFVDTGYFHPMNAGIGEYTIYFSYQDEESNCSDTLTQLALVDLCDGVVNYENAIDFPFRVINQHDQLIFKPFEINKQSPYDLYIYSFSGKLIHAFQHQTKLNLEFFVPPNNPYLIFRVLQNEKEYVFKYQMK